MDTLQKVFEKEMQNAFSFPVIGVKLIKRRLEEKGVFLNKKQTKELEKKLENISVDAVDLDFEFNRKQSKILGISDGEKVTIDIGGNEEELDKIYQDFIAKLENSIPAIINDMAAPILSGLKKSAPSMLRSRRKDMKEFEQRLYQDWKKPFDLFEAFLVLALEAGDEFNSEFRKDKENSENYVLEVLTRIHVRACQIASEILVLLKSGFADGAHARWRSLHELAVVGSFIKTYGNEVAERYLLHDNIESYKAATLYQKHYEALGYEPISQDEFDLVKIRHDKLIERFGRSYKNNYGWASSVLKNEDPTFAQIEENRKLDYLRPFYKLASHNVHANPKGIMFKLGLLHNTENIFLAGPSNVGFTDPAQGAAISLGLITITLLTTKPTIDNLVLCNILLKLQSEIGEEFFKIQKEIEDRDDA